MFHWKALKNGPTATPTTAYVHTPRKNPELRQARVGIDCPADTLALFTENPELAAAVRLLKGKSP